MVKIDALRRLLLPCLTPKATTPAVAAPAKKRISTSLRDDIPDDMLPSRDPDLDDSNGDMNVAASRPSKTMVVGTIIGRRRGHVWFCVQHDRHSANPSLLLELSIPITHLVKEMQSGLVRLALECTRSDLNSCHLHHVPEWLLYCNGKKAGFAVRRKASGEMREMLRKMQNTTMGAGVIDDGIMYMRANYERVVGSLDSESFHLINPHGHPNQEFSLFLLRSTSSSIY
uniref:Protein MIZU-KUSSEI 1 n=1 Tax=Kalanchoe fedtschenkoi TaxID=63787 RepID=A0A7N0TY68_KALFE